MSFLILSLNDKLSILTSKLYSKEMLLYFIYMHNSFDKEGPRLVANYNYYLSKTEINRFSVIRNPLEQMSTQLPDQGQRYYGRIYLIPNAFWLGSLVYWPFLR